MAETTTPPSETDGKATQVNLDVFRDASPPATPPGIGLPSPIESDDWTCNLPVTDQLQLFRSTNWAASQLGPLNRWSLALRLHTFTVLADSRPGCLYWGPSKTAIYNEHFAIMAEGAHPMLMGRPFQQAFPELWGDIQGVFQMAEQSGLAVNVDEIPLFTERNGYLEETYFTGNFNPVRDVDGSIGGVYNSAHEITNQIIRNRRAAMMNSMTVPSGLVDERARVHFMPSLENNPHDITMVLAYKAEEDMKLGTTQLQLVESLGVPAGHELAVEETDLLSTAGIIPLLLKAKSAPITVPVDQRFDGIEWRGFGEPSKYVTIMPVSGAGRLFGFLVIGANPRRPIDEDHHQFMKDIAAKVSIISSSVLSHREAERRAERLEKDLGEKEQRIRFLAQNATVGMAHVSLEGGVIWANDSYYKLTGHPLPGEPQYKFSFLDVVIEDEKIKVHDAWSRLVQGQNNINIELRLKKMFVPPSGDPEPTCILALAFPYSEDGKVKSIMACVTDISQIKWAESMEVRKASDAREAKRQQEEFIDIVSHEMRNPLSAIFQCADMIQSSLAECEANGSSKNSLMEALRSNAEAASTILLCANHQKRIVDDVLTLSKLEYMMLSVSPRAVQPVTLVERAVRMFESDFQSHEIKINIIAEPSLEANNVDWILCDPSRVSQIFINLLTNAIKFTRAEPRRELTIRYGATLSNPRSTFSSDMNWAPCHKQMADLTEGAEWGDGESLYLTISVTDTGVGMTLEEIRKLFNRFKQASSRTSIKYGGSGLGLFISQKLAEKQGGEIGVCSEADRGSTFAIYVKARRTEPENAAVASQIHRPGLIHAKSTPRPSDPVPSLDNMHVLLVEDNIVNQKVLYKQLTNAGCVVHIANHGMEALDFLRTSSLWHEAPSPSKRLDIILMDWEMPIMDGLTCSREIRGLEMKGELTGHVEIMAITANAREEQIENALKNGIDSVMSKPFLTADLLNRMKERLEAGAVLARNGGVRTRTVSL